MVTSADTMYSRLILWSFFQIIIYGFVVAIYDLVHVMETIHRFC